MAAKKNQSAASSGAALSPEEFQKLTPEEQLAYVTSLQKANAEATAKADAAEKKAAAAVESAEKAGVVDLPVLEGVEADEDNDIEAGDYKWTAPTFTYDDNKVYAVKDLMADAASKDKKVAEKATTIIANLLARKSGLLVRIQETED